MKKKSGILNVIPILLKTEAFSKLVGKAKQQR